MAHSRSARKRVRINLKARAHNRPIKSQAKTYSVKAEKLIQAGELELAEAAVREAISVLDKTSRKGIIHSNNAARRKSHLVKSLNKAKSDSK